MTISRRTKISLLGTTLLVGALALPSLSQNAPPDNGGQGANGAGGGAQGQGNQGQGGGGGRNFDPAAMRQRMLDGMKTQLGMTDEEFTAVQPKIEKVMQLTREANAAMANMMRRGGRGGGGRQGGGGGGGGGAGGPGGGGGGGGAGGGGGDQATSDVQTKLKDLQAALDNKDTSADDLKTKLQAYRDAHTAAKADLGKAQDDLKSVLTARQEAAMVTMGMLE